MSVDRSDLHALLDRVPESDLPVTRKLLQALAAGWDVATVESEGELAEQAKRDVEAAEAFFDPVVRVFPTKTFSKNSIWPDALFHLGTRGSSRPPGIPRSQARQILLALGEYAHSAEGDVASMKESL